MEHEKIVILGAGIAGLSASYFLSKRGAKAKIYEKNKQYGGLCDSFVIEGFTFDTFAHLTFSKNKIVNEILEGVTPYYVRKPEAYNYYQGNWIRNPVQNNLYELSPEEKTAIIKGYIERPSGLKVENYEQWLRKSYGNYFAEHFPMRYTRKYWTVNANMLEYLWVKNRMYVPALDEMLLGAFKKDSPCVHYSGEMHYPIKGGYRSFLKPLAEDACIEYNREVTLLDPFHKTIGFSNGEKISYDHVITTLPLTELPDLIPNLPENINRACKSLDYTSGILISIGFKRKIKMPALWFYIYDEEILPARVYSPNEKAPANVPEGFSSIQAELYFSKYKPMDCPIEKIMSDTVEKLCGMGLFDRDDILFTDARIMKYANIIFTPGIYKNRDRIHEYLDALDIIYAGRFGEWDYLWSDQSLLSGKAASEKYWQRKGSL